MPRMPQQRPAGRPAMPAALHIDTPRFYLRTLRPADASERWLAWARDPEVMEPLNSEPWQMSLAELRNYIARHDQETRLLIGVFVRRDDLHIGFYLVELEPRHNIATLNVVIGDKAYWGQRVVLETRAALLDYLFRRRGVEKAIGQPLARNFPAIFNYRAQGWRLEGVFKAHRKAWRGSGRLDQLQFGLTRQEWRDSRARKEGSA